MEALHNLILAIGGFLYQPYIVPLILLAGGIIFTCRTKLLQIRLFPEACRVIMEKPSTENGISSFGALMVSTASRVGTGNIIGVSTAICMGGPGALFWMWVTAFLGGASAFVESTLAQIYKRKNDDGSSYGGPAFYMEQALKQRWLGVIFSVIIILTYAVGYNMLASYNFQDTLTGFSWYKEGTTPVIVGIVLAVLFGIIVIGGARRLIKVTEVLVPIMGIAYVIIAIIVMFINFENLGAMFHDIFSMAFDFHAIFGGFTGSCIMWGIKRGLYSNEAGMGSAPNAAATADISHPAKQGLVQMLSVFIDTLLICTATGFMCLSSGVAPAEDIAGAAYVQSSLAESLGNFGPVFIACAMALFAFTTLIGNYSYCEGCLRFILKRKANPTELLIFRLFATLLVFLGAIATAAFVWDTADMLQGMMVIINVPTIFILCRRAVLCLNDYCDQKKAGKNPVFNAKAAGITEETEFWK